VSSVNCDYLLKILKFEFLSVGGDILWLYYGLNYVPKKLQKIARISNILAHQPWKIHVNDIQEIINSNSDNWVKEEFIQAALILVNFQRLAIIGTSVGIHSQSPSTNDQKGKLHIYIIGSSTVQENKTLINSLDNTKKPDEKQSKESNSSGNDCRKCSKDSKESIVSIDLTKSMELISDDYKEVPLCDVEKFRIGYCTLYLDFDSHSDKYISDLVNYVLI